MRTDTNTLLGLGAVFGAVAHAAVLSSKRQDCTPSAQWPGWSGIQNAFIFGDSYTQTGFDYTSTQPSASNPLGNPPYPGWTSSNGPNWVGYLTFAYNATSALRTYNFAYGGATVDSDLVAPYDPSVLSLSDQVTTQFIPGYGSGGGANSSASWSGADSVFAVWIGINDVGNSWWLDPATERDALYDDIFAVYSGLAADLAGAGARNFVFVNVPPVERSPMIALENESPEWAVETCGAAVADWNARVEGLAATVQGWEGGAEMNVWVYDSYADFDVVMDAPGTFEQTAGLKNTTEYCVEYQSGTAEEDTFIESCGVPVNQYFWLNNLHPTPPIHEVVAAEVAAALEAGPNVC